MKLKLFVGNNQLNAVMKAVDLADDGAKVFGQTVEAEWTNPNNIDLEQIIGYKEDITVFAAAFNGKIATLHNIKRLSDGKHWITLEDWANDS